MRLIKYTKFIQNSVEVYNQVSILYMDSERQDRLPIPNSQNIIDLSGGNWTANNMGQKILQIRQWKFDGNLILAMMSEATILKQIEHIRFPNLSIINISCNDIETLQNISTIFLPSLFQFTCASDYITSVKSLRKTHWPQLKRLIIYANYFRDCESLGQMRLNREQIVLGLQGNLWHQICQDIRFILKLESESCWSIYLKGGRRIHLDYLYRKIKQVKVRQGSIFAKRFYN